jgi:hypothetical protein
LVDEVAGSNGQVCIIDKIPKGGMRIADAGDHLEVFAESAEHIPAVLVDLSGPKVLARIWQACLGRF